MVSISPDQIAAAPVVAQDGTSIPNDDDAGQIEQELAGIMSMFGNSEPLYCLCSGPYMTGMIACTTCCNYYHPECLHRFHCQYTKQPYICPLCDQSLTMKDVAILDEKLYRESQARTRASKKSRSSFRQSDLFIDDNDIILDDDIVPIEPFKPTSAATKKSKSKKSVRDSS